MKLELSNRKGRSSNVLSILFLFQLYMFLVALVHMELALATKWPQSLTMSFLLSHSCTCAVVLARQSVLLEFALWCFNPGARSLAEACLEGDVSAVRKLLEEGWSVHEPTDEGESLLSLACSAGTEFDWIIRIPCKSFDVLLLDCLYSVVCRDKLYLKYIWWCVHVIWNT